MAKPLINLRNLRGRLIGWHLFILVVSLALFSVLLYAFLSRSLYEHHDAELAIEAGRLTRALAGSDFTQGATTSALSPSQISEEFVIVRNPQGELLYRSPLLQLTEPKIGEHEALVHAAALGATVPQFFTAQLERTGPVRFICVPIDTPPRAYLQLGRPLGDVPETLRAVALACALLVPIIPVLMSFGGWVIAGRALAPMRAINETLQAIQATDLSRRLDVPADAELGGLVTTLNRLLARLEKAFSSLKQFTADISHQLQTPLTVIKGTVDVALGSTRTPAEYQGALDDIGEEIDEMTSILADLRALSLADAGPGASEHGAVNLSDVAREVAEILEALAESKHISVDTAIDPGLTVWGSGVGLKQVLLNLVDNAVNYTGADEGRIRFQLRAEAHEAVLTVSDTGVGIAPEDLPRVFDRFYRVPGSDARSRGTGLGLAIVKRIVEAHGGSVTVESRLGEGSTFTVRLPLAR
ncbi:MAG TPA: HAMP domain-containing sensor histidine kinase [Vicinamibacterales bacterium]